MIPTGSTAGLSSAGNTVAKSYKKVSYRRFDPEVLANLLSILSDELLHSQLFSADSDYPHSSVSDSHPHPYS